MTEFVAGALSNALGELVADLFGESLKERSERRALQRAIAAAVTRAEEQFAQEYATHDPELVQVLIHQTRFADLPSVRAALRDLLAQPFHDPQGSVAVLRRSFAEVLPERTERERVDAAVRAFLSILGREVLYIPQLRDLYALSFQKLSAESGRATAEHTAATTRQLAALADGFRDLQESLRLIATAPEPRLIAAPRPTSPERQRPWHNLPQRNYAEFIGRQAELEQLGRLMLPHPRSRHFVVTIDGIGGIGKSALALELAYGYRTHYGVLPEDERFETIVWVSAKRTLLTASGIQQRRQSFNTLDDLFREVATVLEQPAILQASLAERRGLVERALAARRCLLIVDNLETVDDEELLSFLRELPEPTKALITTRHRIDIAYALRLTGMPREDALKLMQVEAEAKGVTLSAVEMDDLERRTGGVPLAIQWSIGLMSLGHSVEAVLRRLGQGQSDIARFCFAESVARIRGRDAHRLLLALALFERSVSRVMLGEVAGLADDPVGRDEGLAELLRLSLVNQKGDRFSLLPLTHAFAREELATKLQLEQELRERWITSLRAFALPYAGLHTKWRDIAALNTEGEHLVTLARWAQDRRPDLFLDVLPAISYYSQFIGNGGILLELLVVGLEYARLEGRLEQQIFLLERIARLLDAQRAHHEAEAVLAEALQCAQKLGDPAWQAEVLLNHARFLRHRGLADLATERCDAGGVLAAQAPPSQQNALLADIANERGKIARDAGDLNQARNHFLAALEVYRLEDAEPRYNRERTWTIVRNLAFVEQRLGNNETARRMYLQAIDYFRSTGDLAVVATMLVPLGILELDQGNARAAEDYAAEALEISQQLGMQDEQQQAQNLLARLGSNR